MRFSVILNSGIEIVAWESENYKQSMIAPQLMSSLLAALRLVSESLDNPFQHIQFSNMMLYLRTYRNFALKLLLDGKINEKNLKHILTN